MRFLKKVYKKHDFIPQIMLIEPCVFEVRFLSRFEVCEKVLFYVALLGFLGEVCEHDI